VIYSTALDNLNASDVFIASRGVIPGLDCAPTADVVKQTALDDVCGPAPTESAGSDQENGLALLA
jgi:hypothetical protein